MNWSPVSLLAMSVLNAPKNRKNAIVAATAINACLALPPWLAHDRHGDDDGYDDVGEKPVVERAVRRQGKSKQRNRQSGQVDDAEQVLRGPGPPARLQCVVDL